MATLSDAPERQTFADVARALACAARVVRPGGQIVVLSRTATGLGPSAEPLREAESPVQGLAFARQHKLPDALQVWQLAIAAQHARIYLLSDMPEETVEGMFMTPLERASQVQRLINNARSCLFLPDAHRTLAVLGNGSPV